MHSVCSVTVSLVCWTPQLQAHRQMNHRGPTAPSPAAGTLTCAPTGKNTLDVPPVICLRHSVYLVVGSWIHSLVSQLPYAQEMQTYKHQQPTPRCPGLSNNSLGLPGPSSSQLSDLLISPVSDQASYPTWQLLQLSVCGDLTLTHARRQPAWALASPLAGTSCSWAPWPVRGPAPAAGMCTSMHTHAE